MAEGRVAGQTARLVQLVAKDLATTPRVTN